MYEAVDASADAARVHTFASRPGTHTQAYLNFKDRDINPTRYFVSVEEIGRRGMRVPER